MLKYIKNLMRPETEIPPKPLTGRFHHIKYTGRFIKNLVGANKFFTQFNAVQNGGIFIGQALLTSGIASFLHFLPPLLGFLSFLPPVLGIAAGVAFAAIGLCAIRYGLPKAWKTMEEICAQTFPKFNPLKKIREPLQRFKNNVAQTPLGKKIFRNHGKPKKHLLSQRKQELFLTGITLEGTLITTAAVILTAVAVISAPAIPIAAAAGAAAVAVGWTAMNMMDIVWCKKTVTQVYRDYKKEKKLNAKAATSTPPQQEATTGLRTTNATSVFNEEAEQAKSRYSTAAPILRRQTVPGMGY